MYAQLVFGIMYNNNLSSVKEILTNKYGFCAQSDILDFKFTNYYQKEFGKTSKLFMCASKIIISDIPQIKLFCHNLENSFSVNGNRTVNIDPGYVTHDSVILASLKRRPHRIYLNQGVYADLQLVFEHNKWRTFDWTFPDIVVFSPFFSEIRGFVIYPGKYVAKNKSIDKTP